MHAHSAAKLVGVIAFPSIAIIAPINTIVSATPWFNRTAAILLV
jgi:hypothetical protein